MNQIIRCGLRVEDPDIEIRTGDRVARGPLHAPPAPPREDIQAREDEDKEFFWWRLDEEPLAQVDVLDDQGKPAFPFSTDLIAYRGEARSEWLNSDILIKEFHHSYGDEERIRQRIPHLVGLFGPLGSRRCLAVNPSRGYPHRSITAAEPFDEWAGNIAWLARIMGARKLCSDIKTGRGAEVLASLRYKGEREGGLPDIEFPFTGWIKDKETFVRYTSLFPSTSDRLSLEWREYSEEEIDTFLRRYIEAWLVEQLKNQHSLSMVDFELVYKPASLKGMLWELVRREVSDDKRIFGVCPRCKSFWSRTGYEAKPNTKYCNDDCGNAAKQQMYRDRKKAAVQMSREGMTVPQIAEQIFERFGTDTDEDIISGWIKKAGKRG